MRKVHEQQVEEIMVQLVTQARAARPLPVPAPPVSRLTHRALRCAMQVLTGKEEQRDICSIGLKTVVLEMPGAMAVTAVRQLAPKLVSGMPAAVSTWRVASSSAAPSARPASR